MFFNDFCRKDWFPRPNTPDGKYKGTTALDIFPRIATKIIYKNIENLTEIEKQQIPRGAREARPPWGAAEGGALVVFVFLVDFLYIC